MPKAAYFFKDKKVTSFNNTYLSIQGSTNIMIFIYVMYSILFSEHFFSFHDFLLFFCTGKHELLTSYAHFNRKLNRSHN